MLVEEKNVGKGDIKVEPKPEPKLKAAKLFKVTLPGKHKAGKGQKAMKGGVEFIADEKGRYHAEVEEHFLPKMVNGYGCDDPRTKKKK